MLGPKASHNTDVSLLTRVTRWTNERILYEADPKHGESFYMAWTWGRVRKELSTPGTRETTDYLVEGDTSKLNGNEAT